MKRSIAGLLVLVMVAGCGKQAAVIKRIPTSETKKEEVKQAEPVKRVEVKKEEVKAKPAKEEVPVKKEEVPVKKEEAKQAEPTATPEPEVGAKNGLLSRKEGRIGAACAAAGGALLLVCIFKTLIGDWKWFTGNPTPNINTGDGDNHG